MLTDLYLIKCYSAVNKRMETVDSVEVSLDEAIMVLAGYRLAAPHGVAYCIDCIQVELMADLAV